MVNDRDCQRRPVGHTRFTRVGTDCPESLDGGTEMLVDMGKGARGGLRPTASIFNYFIRCCAHHAVARQPRTIDSYS